MKLSCLPVTFFGEIMGKKTMTREDWIKIAVEHGLDGTEVYDTFVGDLDAAGMAGFADVVHDAGLQVSMYSVENDFSRPEKHGDGIAQVKEAVDAALIFKADIVRVTAASPFGARAVDRTWLAGANREDAVQSCADGLRACLDYAEEKQVTLALEDHPDIGWNLEEFLKILELVDDERLKVNLDTSNVHPDTIVDLAGRVADRVVHLHVKDRLNNDHGIVMGKGEVDFAGIFRALKDVGFDSWISLEVMAGGKENLRLAVEHITDVWNNA